MRFPVPSDTSVLSTCLISFVEIKERCLLVQFGGAVETIASLRSDETGFQVREQLAAELGLKNSGISGHVARDKIAEILFTLALVVNKYAKEDRIGLHDNVLGRIERSIEAFVPHRGTSSTMPQKRNHISSEVILATSKMLFANASLSLDAFITHFERASGLAS
ncbi:Fumarate lyase [Penicillium antarcticum]|nr:Fumarate lyase [Penicillium antarcticum]KAJ5312022.1 Fumarate lyase [Penicillium antarcticum]